MSIDKKDLERRMEGALASLQSDLAGLRTGRASPNLLDSVMVPAYGSSMPLNQGGSVSVLDARTVVGHGTTFGTVLVNPAQPKASGRWYYEVVIGGSSCKTARLLIDFVAC